MNGQFNLNGFNNPLGYSVMGNWQDMEKELIDRSEKAREIIVLDSDAWFLVHGNGERSEQFKCIKERAKSYTFILARDVGANDVEVGKALKSLSKDNGEGEGAKIRILGGNNVRLPVEKLVVPVAMGISGRIFYDGAFYTALFTRKATDGYFGRLYLEDSAVVDTLRTMLLNLSVEYGVK